MKARNVPGFAAVEPEACVLSRQATLDELRLGFSKDLVTGEIKGRVVI